MAFRETSDFDMPIPGMAMTHELGLGRGSLLLR